MLAARVDQENLIHEQHTVVAGKPLNQGLRGYTAKTPGNKAPKTPFKIPLNDENTYNAGKSGLKTNGKGFDKTVTKKGPVFDKNAFITPAGPRNRPALGIKTTNAKANFFKTPGNQNAEKSPQKTQKTGSPRLRRPKLKVLNNEVAKVEQDDEEAEIEFMPPRSIPMPDIDSDDEFAKKDFSELRGANLMTGMSQTYFNPLDDEGFSQNDRESQARMKQFDIDSAIELQKALDDDVADAERNLLEDLGIAPPKPTAVQKKAPGTLVSRNAASALSKSSKPTPRLTTAPAQVKAKPRINPILNIRKVRQPAPLSTDSSSQRAATASAASRSTLGYARGRAVSQRVRKPATSVFKDEAASGGAEDAQALKAAGDIVSLLRNLDVAEEDEEMLFGEDDNGVIDDDDDFQLDINDILK